MDSYVKNYSSMHVQPDTETEIMNLFNQGMSYREIAERLLVTFSRVQRCVAKFRREDICSVSSHGQYPALPYDEIMYFSEMIHQYITEVFPDVSVNDMETALDITRRKLKYCTQIGGGAPDYSTAEQPRNFEDKIVQLHNEGLTERQIAAAVGTNQSKVHRTIADSGFVAG